MSGRGQSTTFGPNTTLEPAVRATLTADLIPPYTYGMVKVTRTTVYLNRADYERLKVIARARRQAPAALVREAVAEYARRHGGRRFPKSVGAGRSGRGDLSERTEELLAGMGRSS